MEFIIKEIPIKKELQIKKHMEHMKQLKKKNIVGYMRSDLKHDSLMTKKIIDKMAIRSKPHARDNEFFQLHSSTRKSSDKADRMGLYEEEKDRKMREEEYMNRQSKKKALMKSRTKKM